MTADRAQEQKTRQTGGGRNLLHILQITYSTDNDDDNEVVKYEYFEMDHKEHMLKHQIASLIQANKEKDEMIASLNDQVANLQLISESLPESMNSSDSANVFEGEATVKDHPHSNKYDSPIAEEFPTETAGCLKDVLGGNSMDIIFEPKEKTHIKAYRSNSVNMTASINQNPSIESLNRRRTRDFSGYSSDGATSHRRVSINKNGGHYLQHRYQVFNGDCVTKSAANKMNSSCSANTVYGYRHYNRGIWNILDRFISINRSKRERFMAGKTNFSENGDDRCVSSLFDDRLRPNASYNPAELAFARWTTDQVCAWMVGIGLGTYVGACRKAIRSGLSIITANHEFLEKELGMKNMLHRKRLLIYLESLLNPSQSEPEAVKNLDIFWVQKWLDDIGLPQYKDAFLDAKIDGRMLHKMTVDDLIYLTITNELHHLSIRRAIQILRLNNFDCDCLKRRPSQDDKGRGIMLWSNHRIMEWLRSVDLSEYAPNLRGSGVHGALVALEPRFNADTLADILSIPTSKTLLRRHLTTKFVALIGEEAETKKIEISQSKNYRRLNIHSKVKAQSKAKYSFFTNSKKGYCERFDRLICPPINHESFRINTRGAEHCLHCSGTRQHRQHRSTSRGPQNIATASARFPSYKTKNSPTTFV